MPLVLIFIAVILLVAAWQNSQTQLAGAIGQDAAGFGIWFAALAIVAGLQWIPGFKIPARWLLGLVLLVLVLRNYQQIFAGFANIGSGSAVAATTPTPSPSAAYTANPSNPQITTAEVQGGTAQSGSQTSLASLPTVASPFAAFSPDNLVGQFEANLPSMLASAAVMGFGGVA